MTGRKGSPQDMSLIIVYSLSKALAISPLEIYKMPASLVMDLLSVHKIMMELEQEEMDKLDRQAKSGVNKFR